MAGATKDARAETSESEFAKNMIKYSFRYGAVGDVEVAEGEHTKVANIKKSLIAQLQIECPLVARDAPYEIDEIGTDGSPYSALYSVRVVADEDKSDWYGGDQLEVSKIVEYISEEGQAKSVDINFRVTSTGVLISADVMGTAAGVVSKLDGMDNTSGDPPKVDASVSTFWSCRPKARRLEETPDSKPEWAIKWDATKTKKTTILHKQTVRLSRPRLTRRASPAAPRPPRLARRASTAAPCPQRRARHNVLALQSARRLASHSPPHPSSFSLSPLAAPRRARAPVPHRAPQRSAPLVARGPGG